MNKFNRIIFLIYIATLLIPIVYMNCGTKDSDVPLLISPSDESIIVENPPTFIWTSVENFDIYWLQVSENSSFNTPVINMTCFTDTNHTPQNPLNSGTYFWRVCAIEGG